MSENGARRWNTIVVASGVRIEGQHVNDLTAAHDRFGSRRGRDESGRADHRSLSGTACSAYRFQEWPAGAGPSRLALPRCPARLAWALARFWCPLSAMVTAVGWSAGGSPARTGLLNRHELDLTGA